MEPPEKAGEEAEGNNAANNEEEDPTVLGGYKIVRAIGKGKFAVVYRAERQTDGEIVALKRIKVDAMDQNARQKCLKEIKLLQSLDHPNIIRYLDSFISDDNLVIVIEWAAAGDLKRQLRKAQERGVGFEERLIWKYFSQICDAMLHMHERRIMHRDLKPANIFLTLDGTIKVGDLGLSRELSEHTIQAHSKVGTPLYMSPEVLRGDGYDFKSDVWSLGCLLYELAMLKSPFRSEGLNLYSLFQKISQGDYAPLPENYSVTLRDLAHAMISTRSEDRPELAHICSVAATMRAQTAKKGNSIEQTPASQPIQQPTLITTQQQQETQQPVSDSKSKHPVTVHAKDTTDDNSKYAAGSKDSYTPTPTSVSRQTESNHDSKRPNKDSRVDVKSVDDDRKSNREFGFNGSDNTSRPDSTQVGAADNKSDVAAYHSSAATGNKRTNTSGWGQIDGDFVAVTSAPQPSSDSARVPYTRPKKDIGGSGSSKSKVEKSRVSEGRKSSAGSTGGNVKDNGSGRLHREDSNSSNNDKSDDETVAANTAQGGGRNSNGKDSKNPSSSAFENASGALALMELVYSKLTVMQYGMKASSPSSFSRRQQFLPVHFAFDLNQCGRIAGFGPSAGGNPRASQHYCPQFAQMVDVSIFLLNQIGGSAANIAAAIDLSRDSPMTACKQLLKAAQAAGVAQELLSDVLPTALTAGFGEKVCLFLNLLCDAAILAQPPATQLMHLDSGADDLKGAADDCDVEDELEESTGVENLDHNRDEHVFNAGESMNGDSELAMSMVYPSVDPATWRAETERVSSLLTAAKKQAPSLGGSWTDNFQQLQSHSVVWASTTPQEAESNISSSGGLLLDTQEVLRVLGRSLHADLEAVSRGETFISKGTLTSMGHEYSTYKQEADAATARARVVGAKVGEITAKLAALEDRLDEINHQLEGQMSGGSGVVVDRTSQIKEAIRTVKTETIDMDLRMGLLSAGLIAKQTQNAHRARQKKQRRNIRGKDGRTLRKGDTPNEVDELEDSIS